MKRRQFLLTVLGFVAFTIVLTYPQAVTLTTSVGPHYDALFSIWRLSWIAHQLPLHPLELFNANIFYPEPLTLAYSDALLFQGLIAAPFLWLGLDPVLVHNVLVLATFVASGVAMSWLVRDLTNSASAGFVAGMIFSFQPYRFGHYTQLELLSGWWIPIALCLFERAIISGSLRQRLVNGYSGFHPSTYIRLLDTLTPFPNPAGIAALEKIGVDYVILHRDLAPPEAWESVNAALRASPSVSLVMTDGPKRDAVAVAVYRIARAPR